MFVSEKEFSESMSKIMNELQNIKFLLFYNARK